MRVLPTKWRRKPAGIDTERNYATVTLCIVRQLQFVHCERSHWFLPARRYASAGISYDPVSVCVRMCLCLSVTSGCSIETGRRIELVFGFEASADQTYTVF